MSQRAFAVAAHPDDIEFLMAGTLLLLGEAGYDLHVMTVANGSCGTTTMGRDEVVALRTREARAAAATLGAAYHAPLADDLQIYYTPLLVAKLAAIVRQVDPRILLIPSPEDYMEDHINVARLMVTAAFARNMRNFDTDPPADPVATAVALYHAMPVGLRDPLRRPVAPDLYVDISSVMDRKRAALSCHRSQQQWLDESQGIGSYIQSMIDTAARVGCLSRRFSCAEGWRRHSHLGFGPEDFDPLRDALGRRVTVAGAAPRRQSGRKPANRTTRRRPP